MRDCEKTTGVLKHVFKGQWLIMVKENLESGTRYEDKGQGLEAKRFIKSLNLSRLEKMKRVRKSMRNGSK